MKKINETVANATKVKGVTYNPIEMKPKGELFLSKIEDSYKVFKDAHEYYMSLDEGDKQALKEQLVEDIDNVCEFSNTIDSYVLEEGDIDFIVEFCEEKKSIADAINAVVVGEEPSEGLHWSDVVRQTIEELKEYDEEDKED